MRVLCQGLLALLLLAIASVAGAEGTPSPPKVEFTVSSILATKAKKDGIDPALQALAPKLRGAFSGYEGFKLVSTRTERVETGRASRFALPTGATLQLGYLGTEGQYIRLELAIPPRLSTRMRVNDGGTFFQAGLDYSSGILVVAITARTVPAGQAPVKPVR